MTKQALNHLQSDPFLSAAIDRFGPIRLKARRLSPFQSIVRAIVFQQLNGAAATTILNRFLALFGKGDFPSPAAVVKTRLPKLRSAGLSRQKGRYIQDVARRALDGEIPSLDECDQMDDEEIVQKLIVIKGVGRWTVEMFLMFNLGRPDILPIQDFGVRRGFQKLLKKRSLPEPEQLQCHGVRWSPFRTTASLYLWRMADSEDGGGVAR